MTADDIVLVAVKSRVMAISKRDGRILWATDLGGGISSNFVTLLATDTQVFAHTKGKVHCLALTTGWIQWTNELPGCGYGIASIALPGGISAPQAGAVQTIADQEAAAGASGGAS